MRFGIRELLYLSVLVGVMVGAYFVVLSPMDEKIEAFKTDTAAKQATLTKLNEAKSTYPDFDAEIKRLEEARAAFERKLPNRREVEVILGQIWEIAKEEQLKVKSIVPDRSIDAAEYDELPIKVEILGDFDGYYAFIKRIEELPRITKMPKITIKKINNDTDGVVRTELRLSIFFRGDDSPTA